MALLEKIKSLRGISGADQDAVLNFLIEDCKAEATDYCNLQEYDENLNGAVVKMVLERYNRMGNEGISGVSYAGTSESYQNDYSESIYKALRKYRRLKTL